MPKNNSAREISRTLNRRRFLYYSTMAAGATALTGCISASGKRVVSANEKLNIAGIGCGGKGASDLEGAAEGQNIVALCDVDETTLNQAAQKYPGAKLYRDYRKMFDQQKDLDAVVVSTPDHHHFPASMMAVQRGKHVYCQKPLTHTIWEARQLTEAARHHGVATQMGNQGHCHVGNRELCEIIWSGAIGDIREVHCWTNRPIWPQGMNRPAGSDPVPTELDWDLWIGSAPMRPFKKSWPDDEHPEYKRAGRSVYHPFSWRGWWDFGCGALGDMGCHVMDGPNWALKLGAPTTVEIVESSPLFNESAPQSAVLRYEFPKRGAMPPVTLTWYDGGKLPPKPAEMENTFPESGSLFIGSKGKIVSDTYGMKLNLLPESKMKDFVKPPPTIPRIKDNNPYGDWIRACKGGVAACSNFEVSGPFSEMVLLGNLTLRARKKILWDAKSMRAKNAPEIAEMIHPTYRPG
ncbi:MAG: Gfo/Idh/MocA family oxidoreductase, partial [Verrucomicrobiota bacterium]